MVIVLQLNTVCGSKILKVVCELIYLPYYKYKLVKRVLVGHIIIIGDSCHFRFSPIPDALISGSTLPF
jgi:hypothetical protein